MKVKHCSFVESSEVFEGCPLAHAVFANSDPQCSWGDNNRSMVTPDVIRQALDEANEVQGAACKQVREVNRRLDALGEMYIDLEN
jgi:hypothetical protein